jgi:hypothetical protein
MSLAALAGRYYDPSFTTLERHHRDWHVAPYDPVPMDVIDEYLKEDESR